MTGQNAQYSLKKSVVSERASAADRWLLRRIGDVPARCAPADFDLSQEKVYTIGRYRDSTILLKSLVVSRRHCRIHNESGSISIDDNQSENGTFVNEVRIDPARGRHRLRAGDVVGVGAPSHENDLTFVFQLQRFPAADPACSETEPADVGGPVSGQSLSDDGLLIVDAEPSPARQARIAEMKQLPANAGFVCDAKRKQELSDARLPCESSAMVKQELSNVSLACEFSAKRKLDVVPGSEVDLKRTRLTLSTDDSNGFAGATANEDDEKVGIKRLKSEEDSDGCGVGTDLVIDLDSSSADGEGSVDGMKRETATGAAFNPSKASAFGCDSDGVVCIDISDDEDVTEICKTVHSSGTSRDAGKSKETSGVKKQLVSIAKEPISKLSRNVRSGEEHNGDGESIARLSPRRLSAEKQALGRDAVPSATHFDPDDPAVKSERDDDDTNDSFMAALHRDAADASSRYSTNEAEYIVVTDDEDDGAFPASQLFHAADAGARVKAEPDGSDVDIVDSEEEAVKCEEESDDGGGSPSDFPPIRAAADDDSDSDSCDSWYLKLSQPKASNEVRLQLENMRTAPEQADEAQLVSDDDDDDIFPLKSIYKQSVSSSETSGRRTSLPLEISDSEASVDAVVEAGRDPETASDSDGDVIPRKGGGRRAVAPLDASESDGSDPGAWPGAGLGPGPGRRGKDASESNASESDGSDLGAGPKAGLARGGKDVRKIGDIERSRVESRRKLAPVVIDAIPLPPRRGHCRGISAGHAQRLYEKKAEERSRADAEERLEAEKKAEAELRRKRQEEQRAPKQPETEEYVEDGVPVKISKQRISSVKTSVAKEKVKVLPVKSKEEKKRRTSKALPKKQRAEKPVDLKTLRSERLKEIAAKAKAEAEKLKVAEDASRAKKVAKKPTVKVTENNRGAFLAGEPNGGGRGGKTSVPPLPKICDLPRIPRLRSSLPPAGTARSSETPAVPRVSPRRSSAPSARPETPSSSSAEILGLIDLNRSYLPLSGRPRGSSLSSASSALRSCLRSPMRGSKRKRVRWNDARLAEVRVCDRYIEPSGVGAARTASDKEIPPPAECRANRGPAACPNLYETICDVCTWNTEWLTEQEAIGEPPPVSGGRKCIQMLTQFTSYADYCKVVRPLMLLNLWASICADNRELRVQEALLVSVDAVEPSRHRATNGRQLESVSCHGLVAAGNGLVAGGNGTEPRHPRAGDLVLFEVALEKDEVTGRPKRAADSKSNVAPLTASKVVRIVFAYVVAVYRKPFNGQSVAHIGLFNLVPDAKYQVFITLLVKARDSVICFHSVMRLKVVSSIRSMLRSFEAISFLEKSPLCNSILNPTQEDYSLPAVDAASFIPHAFSDREKLNEIQLTAVLKTAKACFLDEPKICLIQGPPGTGKSLVIVNLIVHILRSGSGRQPKILLCAPSNAAVDEIVGRLLAARPNLGNAGHFKMVRIGRNESIDPAVAEVCLDELVKKHLSQRGSNAENLDSITLEINTMEAKRTSVQLKLESGRTRGDPDDPTLARKIEEYDRIIKAMRSGGFKSDREKRRDRWQAERTVLDEAHVIACTLASSASLIMENYAGYRMPSQTCCIVDEASQCSEPESLLPLMQGVKTLVLVGDPRQLPATTHCQVAKRLGFGQSLLSRLSKCFTDEEANPIQMLRMQYRMHPSILRWPNATFYDNQLVTPPNVDRNSPLRPYRIINHEFKQSTGECTNSGEAELVVLVVRCVANALAERGLALTIGVVTPYAKQRAKIRGMLRDRGLHRLVACNTVDGYQGKERDVVVMSCVRTHGTGFMTDAQRLNVSLTRARYSMIICANFQSLEADPLWRSLKEDGLVRNATVRLLPRHLQSIAALQAELMR